MRAIPTDLQAHLDSGATTVCHCWRLTRTDDVALGFTDHDVDLVFDGVVHRAGSGLDQSADTARSGFGIGGFDVAGALSDEALSAAELAAGLWDGAAVESWLVNWADVAQRVLLRRGVLGPVDCADGSFRAEILGPAQNLSVTRGRVYARSCDAHVGDERCRVDLTSTPLSVTGAVAAAVSATAFRTDGLGAFPSGWFDRGLLTWQSGPNAGQICPVKRHAVDARTTAFTLEGALAIAPAPGDAFRVTAGCDKSFATCCSKFSNAVNFRGFPHMPGNDAALTYASPLDRNDGGARA